MCKMFVCASGCVLARKYSNGRAQVVSPALLDLLECISLPKKEDLIRSTGRSPGLQEEHVPRTQLFRARLPDRQREHRTTRGTGEGIR
jgi:hypothetical protein